MSARVLKPCGTEAAYQRHIRRRETPDEACYEAAARGRRLRYAAGKDSEDGAAMQRRLLREVIAVLAEAMGVAP